MAVATTLSLILFTRLPRPGLAKTRLIPALGADGAADLQRRMTRLAVARAWAFCAAAPGRRLVIAYDGGSENEMRAWLGPLDFLPQGEGDLGARMQRAVAGEFTRGARSVIVIGADCPRLDHAILDSATRALEECEVTFGPASDGGYYLVGSRKPMPSIFTDIPWSTGEVLATSLRRAQEAGCKATLLEQLPDVDEPADLVDARAALDASRAVSVIIPVLNESANLTHLLPLLVAAQPHEILIADGGSADDSIAVAESLGAKVVHADRGRAVQMNAAARAATGEHLLFLHADTDPPDHFPALVSNTLDQANVAAGAFRFVLREPVTGGALIEKGVALRCALRQLPYGDQGLFLRGALFEALGGFRALPILEDLEMVRRLRSLGRIVITREAARTSSRRWREGGVIRTFLRHQLLLMAHLFGMRAKSPAALQTRRKA
jgi:rSAM/selenodomain-associated transferase 2/rSAM/selenodomain-associated transferase 1